MSFDLESFESQFKSLGIKYNNENSENYSDVFIYNNITKGMGTSLGNSIRRTLFSQIEGLAIQSVSINGISHEFSEVPGVVESAQEIIMNLKKVVFSSSMSSDSYKAVFSAKKSGQVFASNISGSNLLVVNPDLYICTLNEGFEVKVDINVKKGKGIVLVKDINEESIIVNDIYCDSFFCPVEHVNFEVENIENNEFEECLKIYIVTNGAISPEKALSLAMKFISNEILKIENSSKEETTVEDVDKKLRVNSKNLMLKVSDIPGITTRILSCIKILNVTYVGELVKFSKEELLQKPNFGESSLNQLVEMLSSINLNLGMDIDFIPPKNLYDNEDNDNGVIV